MRKLFFLYFFTIYSVAFISFSILFPFPLPNVGVNEILATFSQRLFFPVIVISISSFLSLAILFKNNVKKVFTLTFFGIMFYGSIGYYLYFLRIDKIVVILGVLGSVSLFSLFVRRVSNAFITESLRKVIIFTPLIIILALFSVAFIRSNSLTSDSCSTLHEPQEADACNWSFAMKDNNLDLCLKRDGDGPARCMLEVLRNLYSQNKLTEKTCSTFKNEDAKSVCFNRLAILEENENYCSEVKEWYENRDVYIYTSPFLFGNPLDGRMNMLTRDGCYVNTALKTNNSNPCLLIKDEVLKYGCLVDTKSPLANEKYKNYIESLWNEKQMRGDKGYEEWKKTQEPFMF